MIKIDDEKAFIDNFLLSCRVLGRGIEQSLLCIVIDSVKNEANVLAAEYIPTKKNEMIKDFLSKNGFKKNGEYFERTFENEYKKPKWIEIKWE